MVDKKTVEYVAKLAKIKVTEEEKEFLREQLSKIIDYIDKLKELDVEGVEPMRMLHTPKNIFRDDKVKSSPSGENILKNSPRRQDRYFKIPKVIE